MRSEVELLATSPQGQEPSPGEDSLEEGRRKALSAPCGGSGAMSAAIVPTPTCRAAGAGARRVDGIFLHSRLQAACLGINSLRQLGAALTGSGYNSPSAGQGFQPPASTVHSPMPPEQHPHLFPIGASGVQRPRNSPQLARHAGYDIQITPRRREGPEASLRASQRRDLL